MDSPTAPSLSFRLEGDVSVTVTVVEQTDGTLLFTTTVDESNGRTADINGLFFDFAQPSLVDGLQADGQQVTKTAFAYDDVDNLGGGVNIKGGLVNDTGLFDGGVRFGTSGMAKDDIQSASFTLSHEGIALTLADIAGMNFGVRLTSVGEIDGAREDSLKLGGTAPEQTAPDRIFEGGSDESDDPFDFEPGDGDGPLPDWPDGDGVLIPADEFGQTDNDVPLPIPSTEEPLPETGLDGSDDFIFG